MTVTVDVTDGVCLVRHDAPPVNALDLADVTALHDVFAAPPPGTAAIVWTATGRHFSAGSDVREIEQFDPAGRAAAAERTGDLLRAVEACPVVSIAAVHGATCGTALMAVALCDLRLAATGATFRLPEIKLGMFAGYAAARRALPRGEAVQLALTGEPLTAARAHALGFVQEVVPGDELAGHDRALAVARQLVDDAGAWLGDARLGEVLRRIDGTGFDEGYRLEREVAAAGGTSHA